MIDKKIKPYLPPLQIEIGFGKSMFISKLAAIKNDVVFIGIDIDPLWCQRATKILKRKGFDNLRIVNDDARNYLPGMPSHSQRLLRISEWLEPVSSYFGKDPFIGRGELTKTEVEHVLAVPIKELFESLNRIIVKVGDSWEDRGIENDLRKELFSKHAELENYLKAPEGKKYHPPYLHSIINTLVETLQNNQIKKVGRELARELDKLAKEVLRILCIYDLKNAIIQIHEMEMQNRTLRDFYSESLREPDESTTIVPIANIIKATIRDQGEYAHTKRVELRFEDNGKRIKVKVNVRNVARAMSNILNNAVKYNYTLKKGYAWVSIKSKEESGNVVISIESWGVPITKNEIESGLIYKVGKRGTFAREKGASGNGIGLADAKKVFEEHRGTIEISSNPTRTNGDIPDYKQPFITTVLIRIPICQD